MMILFFLMVVLSALVQLIFPWWSMLLIAALLCFLMGKNIKQSFLTAFFGCGMVWLLYALLISSSSGSLMTLRMAELFSLPGSWLLYLITFLVAAITGSIAAAAGYSLRLLIKK